MDEKPVIIIGGGGHTHVLVGMLQRGQLNIRGIVTRDPALFGTEILGVPVLGHEEEILAKMTDVTLVNGVGNHASRAGSGLDVRARVYRHYHAKGFLFHPIVSIDAIIQPGVAMGDGVQVMPGAVIQPGTMIGENVIINTRASIDHDAVIYPNAHIAPGAIVCGHVVVGEQTHIGAGAVIIQGVHVGSHVVIGAGAVVTRSVPDNAVVRPPVSEQVAALPKV